MSMSKQEPLRIRLSRSNTIAELEEMLQDVKNDPESKEKPGSLYGYTKAALKTMDEITWAMYYIRRRESTGDGRMQSGIEVAKNW